ncbi:AAA family ATPase [Metabacillus arenae]|uniref:AAA family ATPase n=1 Tax=Metabacillus arenae TaxID=2771434 RepID=A0A926NEP4_9BACI|nr:AAA family ATPase [Metabacillus arenae]MBD1379093.1 AAA family ATPase [Metabacillus arenae]
MALKKPSINKISTDIKDLSIYLRSQKKFGKSTLARDVIIEKYGDPEKGLLVALGAEIGFKLLDNLNVIHIETYQELIELKNWLIKEKGKEHNIEMVVFDVAEEIIPMFEKEVIRLSVIDTKKPCKSINSAYGGYGAGQSQVVELIKKYFLELQKASFGVWMIGHTKFRTIKEKGNIEEEGYMQLTSNLQSNYEAAFGDVFDVTLTGYIDREVEEETIGEGDNEKKRRKATGEVRKLYLRSTTLIDAGGRFAMGAVPEYIVFDKPNMAKEFIDIVEKGMALSKTGALNNKDVKVVEPKKEIEEDLIDGEEVIVDETTIEPAIDVEHNKELKKQVAGKYKTATTEQKQQVKEILGRYDATKLDETKPTQMFEDILAIL